VSVELPPSLPQQAASPNLLPWRKAQSDADPDPDAGPRPLQDGLHDEWEQQDQQASAVDDHDEDDDEVPARTGGLTLDGVAGFLGAAAGSLALTWLVLGRLLPVTGVLGFVIFWYLAFLLMYASVLMLQNDRRELADRIARTLVQSAGLIALGALVLVITYTFARGVTALRPNFFVETMAEARYDDALGKGGALHAIVGTLEQVGLAVLLSVPLGIATALFLNEVGGRVARPVRTIIDAMSALPSIVAGLFILATVVLAFGKSGFAASLAISVMMLPIITRTSEVVFRLVPGGLREASLALGASQWRTVWNVVLPTSRNGLLTAVILGVARGVGETAPVLLTAGTTAELNTDPLHGPMLNLPLYIFFYVKQPPAPETIARAYGAAVTLLVIVLSLFVLARAIGRRASTR
jgi:phosphate transport system permease protein